MTTTGLIVRRIVPCLCLVLAGCGGPPPSQTPGAKQKPQETVFDDMVEKKREIPQAIENAQTQHVEDTRRQIEAAEGRDAPAQ